MKFIFSRIAFLTLTSLALNSCSDSKSNDGLTFVNDMENQFAWNENHHPNIVYYKNAHSGKYVSIIDSVNIFSPSYLMKFKDVDSSPLKRVTVGAWFNAQQDGSDPQIAIDIRDKTGNSMEWISQDGKDLVKNTGSWEWVEFTVDLSVKGRNQPDNSLKIYAFNKSGSSCLVDDIQVSYEK